MPPASSRSRPRSDMPSRRRAVARDGASPKQANASRTRSSIRTIAPMASSRSSSSARSPPCNIACSAASSTSAPGRKRTPTAWSPASNEGDSVASASALTKQAGAPERGTTTMRSRQPSGATRTVTRSRAVKRHRSTATSGSVLNRTPRAPTTPAPTSPSRGTARPPAG